MSQTIHVSFKEAFPGGIKYLSYIIVFFSIVNQGASDQPRDI